jgi:hypothetical protein
MGVAMDPAMKFDQKQRDWRNGSLKGYGQPCHDYRYRSQKFG